MHCLKLDHPGIEQSSRQWYTIFLHLRNHTNISLNIQSLKPLKMTKSPNQQLIKSFWNPHQNGGLVSEQEDTSQQKPSRKMIDNETCSSFNLSPINGGANLAYIHHPKPPHAVPLVWVFAWICLRNWAHKSIFPSFGGQIWSNKHHPSAKLGFSRFFHGGIQTL